MGRTDVQVLSPINGRVIGTKEIRVGSDKVSITKLIVRVISGLQLSITPDSNVENGYVAETSVTRKLTAQYQEGLLDIDLEFSDGAKMPLRLVLLSLSIYRYFSFFLSQNLLTRNFLMFPQHTTQRNLGWRLLLACGKFRYGCCGFCTNACFTSSSCYRCW